MVKIKAWCNSCQDGVEVEELLIGSDGLIEVILTCACSFYLKTQRKEGYKYPHGKKQEP